MICSDIRYNPFNVHFSGDVASMGMAPRLGSPLLTRWLLFAALKETYSECPSALDDAMAMVLEDLNFACHTGVTVNLFGQSRRLRFVAVSVKGDWPFLIEAAHLERHFRRAPKRERSDMCSNLGVCHLCLGGYQGIPYEDFAEVPQWEQTMQSAAAMVPWHSESPWHSLPSLPYFRPWTFRPDIFHNFHLGHGRYFVSSALVVLAAFQEGTSVETRFQSLSHSWVAFCRRRGVPWMHAFSHYPD